jgi:16S rRNA (cytosine967-C5)-methyltransferase
MPKAGSGGRGTTARDVALRALLRVERDEAFSGAALDAELEKARGLDSRDRGLATELVYGATRRRLRLDHAIAAASDRSLARLEHLVLCALRLGAYQLLYLPRVSGHAAVNETLDSLKRTDAARAVGFANAVLRKVSAGAAPLPQDPMERLSIEESHPRWLVDRWVARLGPEETALLCEADNVAPAVALRVQSHRVKRDDLLGRFKQAGLDASASPISPFGIRVEGGGSVPAFPGFKEGLFQVQDDAAQLVVLLAGVQEGQRVLDICAAPGGKTCAFAEETGPSGRVVAVDVSARKLKAMCEESARLHVAGQIDLACADASQPLPIEKSFDAVVVDAPCTGLGTLRRHPELRYRRNGADPARMSELQRRILLQGSRHVAVGGALIYAVCSPEPEEGPAVVEAFLAESGKFALAPPPAGFAGPIEGNYLRTWPHRQGCDAFFAARMQRG